MVRRDTLLRVRWPMVFLFHDNPTLRPPRSARRGLDAPLYAVGRGLGEGSAKVLQPHNIALLSPAHDFHLCFFCLMSLDPL